MRIFARTHTRLETRIHTLLPMRTSLTTGTPTATDVTMSTAHPGMRKRNVGVMCTAPSRGVVHLGLPSVVASLAVALGCVLGSSSAHAAHRFGDTVIIERDEVISENLTVAGRRVEVLGTVQGDVVALGNDVLVDAEIGGDVFASGAQVTVAGTPGADVRAVAGTFTLRAPVEGEVSAAGGSITIEDAVVGPLLIAGGTVDIRGPAASDALLAGGTIQVDSAIEGDTWVSGTTVTFGPNAHIGGDVTARTRSDVVLAPGAVVEGVLEQTRMAAPHPLVAAGVAWAQLLVGLVLLAFIVRFAAPTFSHRSATTLTTRPGKSIAVGAVAMVAIPALLGLCATVGVFVGGWWIAILGAFLYAIAIACSAPIVALTMAHRIAVRAPPSGPASSSRTPTARTLGRNGGLIAVLASISLLAVVPGLGPVVVFFTTCAGLGAMTLAAAEILRQRRTGQRPQTEPSTPPAKQPLPPPEPSPAGA